MFSSGTIDLAIDIAFACFRYGYFRDGTVSEDIVTEATCAVGSHLAAGADPQSPAPSA